MIRADIKQRFLIELVKQKKITSKQQELLNDLNSFVDIETRLRVAGWVEVEELAKIKADFFKLAYADLVGEKIITEVIKLIPKELAENYKAVAFANDDSVLSVGLVEPTDLKAQEALEFLARENNLKAKFFAISFASFDAVIKQYSALKTEVAQALGVAHEKLVSEVKDENIEDLGTSAPITKMVSVIIKHAVEERASDIHIEPVMNQTRVRYRVDGIMKTSLLLPKYVHPAIVSRIKVMSNLKIDETRIPQDGRIRLKISDRYIDFRVSTLPLYNNEKVVMRILDTSSGTFDLEKLGFEGRNLEIMQDNIHKPHGMFLVTGPTGSGKSTTLYAVLGVLNRESVNIVTLEDPVEYYLKGVNQSQINPNVGLTFASGLRSILRQDPDVIMVGEIRDTETANLGVHASLTGHIVLSTLHTNDAFGAIPRLLDLQVENFLLASTINVIVAQRLVRKLCPDCKVKINLPEAISIEVREEISNINPKFMPENISISKEAYQAYKANGCQRCGSTGYSGRLAISEVLPITDEIKSVIIEHSSNTEEMKRLFYEMGMLTMKQDGMVKVLRGLTSVEEVLKSTKD